MDKRELRDRLLPYLVHDRDCRSVLFHEGLCDCHAVRNTERIIDLIGDAGPIATWFWSDVAGQLRVNRRPDPQ